MIYFTICSRNFIGYAEALRTSLSLHHPNAKFCLILCDALEGFDRYSFPYPVVSMEEIGIPHLEAMKTRYNITELNTSLKPFAFLYLFTRHPGEKVVYLDPDIYVASAMTELSDALDAGADCVLTPHISEPSEFADMDDFKFLSYGIYNLGFCALRDTAEVRRIVAWWARRLERHCIIDLPNGLFVDQKWADYLPAFIEKTTILRHPGYNVAYWNLSQRRISKSEMGWEVNKLPLRFFHFSGNRIEDEDVFTRHNRQFNIHNTSGLREILEEYRQLVFRSGHDYYSSLSYAFSWSGSAGHNDHTPESFQRKGRVGYKPHLPVLRSRSLEAFKAARLFNGEGLASRYKTEVESIPHNNPFVCHGYCAICANERSFQVSQMYASRTLPDGRVIPNWREHLNCLTCGTVNRIRGSLHIYEQEFGSVPVSRVYITEQVTSLFKQLQGKWPDLEGSEYLGPNIASGTVLEGVRHEDVQCLSYADESFDLIMSYDVLEHVPSRQKAFREIHRCLSPGGRFFFTVPFSYDNAEEVVRAILEDNGTITHLLDPEYHGNPVDMEGGSLCFRYFAWSVIEHLRDAGFKEVEVISYWSKELLYFGDPQFVITGVRLV